MGVQNVGTLVAAFKIEELVTASNTGTRPAGKVGGENRGTGMMELSEK